MKTFFAVQSFKTTISALGAYKIAIRELHGLDCTIIPITDGGDGFLDTVKFQMPGGKIIISHTVNANNNRIKFGMYEINNCIYIESADIIGIKRIRRSSDPFKRTTKGLGVAVKKALRSGKKVYVGLGGSATIDMGAGFLKEMGVNIIKHDNTEILKDVTKKRQFKKLFFIPDVKNYLEGQKGALMYAEQKGVKLKKKNFLGKYYNRGASILNMKKTCYAGAAGGLGASFMFIGAKPINNNIFMERLIGIKRHIDKSKNVITCEGRFDEQSFKGKITGNIVDYALKKGKNVYIITGFNNTKRKSIKFFLMGKSGLINPKKEFRKQVKKLRTIL